MKFRFLAATLIAVLAAATPAWAHHPGDDLDGVMGSKEEYFQAIDKPAPRFSLRDAEGAAVTLDAFADKIVVLHFVYTGCPDVCPLHAEKLAEVQTMINRTPMKDMVQFVSVTTDPLNDTPEVLESYGRAHGLDPANWTFLTTTPDQEEGTTRALAESFGHRFARTEGGYQTHGVVTHVIDRAGRWAANFHGLQFESLNLLLYINGLSNQPPFARAIAPPPGWWDRLKGLL